MRYITAKTSQVITLGRQGENEALQVKFPVMANLISTYGAGTVSLVAQRPREPFPYFVDVTSDSTYVYWTVRKEDLAIPGDGLCQINYIVDDVVVKSLVYKTVITPSVGENTKELNPYASWIDDVLQSVSEVDEAAEIILGTALPFIATYGTTSYSDITQAISQGRPVIAINSNGQAALLTSKSSSNAYWFERISGDDRVRWSISTGGTWSSTTTDIGDGDMKKSSYDTTNTGNKVDTALNAEKLGGTAASGYLKSADAGTTFPKPGLVYASATCNTLAALKTQLNTWASDMAANTVRFYLVQVGTGYSYDPFVQAGYLLMLYKRSSELACAFFVRASSSGNVVISMTMTTTNSVTTWSDPAQLIFGDQVVAESQVRNIYAGTTDMTAGSTNLATGRIYLVYEV